MAQAQDIDGYTQGHRFSSDEAYYDSDTKIFNDLAGGNRFGNYVENKIGNATFHSIGTNNREGLYLDNTSHWKFPHSCPWQGSGLMVVKLNYVTSGTTSFFPLVFSADVGSISSEPKLSCLNFSGQTRLTIDGGSGQLSSEELYFPNEQIAIIVWSRNQEDRTSKYSLDGVTVNVTDPYDTTNANGNFIGLGGQPHSILGALKGDYSDTTDASTTNGSLEIFEQHFWSTDILKDDLAKTKIFIDSLKSYYGIT